MICACLSIFFFFSYILVLAICLIICSATSHILLKQSRHKVHKIVDTEVYYGILPNLSSPSPLEKKDAASVSVINMKMKHLFYTWDTKLPLLFYHQVACDERT